MCCHIRGFPIIHQEIYHPQNDNKTFIYSICIVSIDKFLFVKRAHAGIYFCKTFLATLWVRLSLYSALVAIERMKVHSI